MAGVRGLQRLPEVDDCLLRITKGRYEEYFKCELGVFMMSLYHDWPRDSIEIKDEPILVVCLLDGNLKEAAKLGTMYPPFQTGDNVVDMLIGTIRTQLFIRVESAMCRPFRSSQFGWMAEAETGEEGSHMKTMLETLSDEQAGRMVAVLRKDLPVGKHPQAQARWIILVNQRGGSD